MSEILSPSAIDDLFDRLLNTTDDWLNDVQTFLAHDAALRARVAELEAALREIAVGLREEDHASGVNYGLTCAARLAGIARAVLATKEAGREA